jgi:ketosteroid isomerase-like protein
VKSCGRLFGVSTICVLLIVGNSLVAAERHAPSSSEAVLRSFYAAVSRKDIATARAYLDKDLKFYGLFETYNNADEYVAALTGLLGVTERLNVRTIVAQGENAAVFFDLKTIAPVAGDTLVAEWHQVRGDKIVRVRSAFDGRLFAPMFEAKPGDQSKSESAIEALNEVFASAFIGRNPKLRASVWLDGGTLAPPTGGLFKGREQIEKEFKTEVGAVTDTSAMEFSNYHFDFQGPDIAFVDVDLTIRNVKGPDGTFRAELPVSLFIVAVREHGRWGIRAERARFR